MKIFKKGDFIRVLEGMHEEGMPPSRLGHIISEEIQSVVHYTNKGPVPTGTWEVMMVNGYKLKIHEMFLEEYKNDI
tara:strand:- start:163 stop:390 length:228 start_codon:yes stop_codon:yes gene_type:complete